MRDIIKRKLDVIDSLFPQEILRQASVAGQRFGTGRIYRQGVPYQLYGAITYGQYKDLDDKETRLDKALDKIIFHGMAVTDDFIPALFPGCRQSPAEATRARSNG